MAWNKRVEVPEPYWLSHQHWVREAEHEGRGRRVPASLQELPPALRADVEAEIAEIGEGLGWDRAPRLWKRVA